LIGKGWWLGAGWYRFIVALAGEVNVGAQVYCVRAETALLVVLELLRWLGVAEKVAAPAVVVVLKCRLSVREIRHS
jgi:hypothetical protein